MQGDRTGKCRRWVALSAVLLGGGMWASLGIGCGAPAAPLPPTLNLPVPVHALPGNYVSSEETSLVQWLNGGDARPAATPPMERGFQRSILAAIIAPSLSASAAGPV